MRPTQWLSGKRKGDASDFSLTLSKLVAKLPLIYLQAQQMKKLARLAFCEKEKINHNKILSYSKKIGKVMSEGYPTLFFFVLFPKWKHMRQ